MFILAQVYQLEPRCRLKRLQIGSGSSNTELQTDIRSVSEARQGQDDETLVLPPQDLRRINDECLAPRFCSGR